MYLTFMQPYVRYYLSTTRLDLQVQVCRQERTWFRAFKYNYYYTCYLLLGLKIYKSFVAYAADDSGLPTPWQL